MNRKKALFLDRDGVININQDGVEANIIVNGGGSGVVFNIKQTQ